MKSYYHDEFVTIYYGDAFEIIPELGFVDHVIADPPFSERTHRGHNSIKGIHGRRGIKYESWTEKEIENIMCLLSTRCIGWHINMTDHVLFSKWEQVYKKYNLYTFAPVPYVLPGSRFRINGDGPASWTVQLAIARPKMWRFIGWGSLPGCYYQSKGMEPNRRIVGSKSLWLMKSLVRDYSREGDIILDYAMGSGTTLRAAKDLRRCAIGIELNEERCEIAADWMRQEVLL